MKETYLTYALNAEGKLVHIDSVPNGKACGCLCTFCGEALQAKQGAKRKQDELYQDYIKAWKNNAKNYDEEQENANSLARLLMLWFDRVEGWEDKEKAVEEFIKTLSPEDVVSEDSLKRFKIKK